MKIRLHSTDIADIVLENSFPDNYKDVENAIMERVIDIDNCLGRGMYKDIFFEGIRISYGDLRLRENALLSFESDFETVEMHFDLSGESITHLSSSHHSAIRFLHNTHNIMYAPGVKGRLELSPTSRMIEVNLNPAIFEKYVESSDIHKRFLTDLKNQNPSIVGKHNMPITPDMMKILNDIIECPKTGIYKRMYLEAKVIELLMLQLEQFAAHDCHVFCSLKPADIDKMHYARKIILERIHNPCSLIDLARQIGTNEFTLKKGFKEVFGTTVFGMVADVKLMQAKEMLLSGEKNISEISLDTGYKNPTHFSAAFKKRFGVSPSKYRVTRVGVLN